MNGARISNLGWSVRQRIGEGTVWMVIRTQKQFTIAVIIATIIAIHHYHAAAAVEVGLKFFDVVNSVVGIECIEQLRATSSNFGSNCWWLVWSIVTAVQACRICVYMVIWLFHQVLLMHLYEGAPGELKEKGKNFSLSRWTPNYHLHFKTVDAPMCERSW